MTNSVFTPYLGTFLIVLAVTVTGRLLQPVFDMINIAFLYLLPVLISAVRWGRGPSFFASFLGVVSFDFFFVPPVLSFTVSDVRYIFTFAIFLLVALVTGTMATKLRDQVESAQKRERRTFALYDLSRKIAAESNLQTILDTVVTTVSQTIAGEAAILIPAGEKGTVAEMATAPDRNSEIDVKERAVAYWALEHGRRAGRGTDVLGAAEYTYFPIRTENETIAVLAVRTETLLPEQMQVLETLTNLAAIAIGRVRLAKEVQQAQLLAESERLHAALLNSISHDLRTPLASIIGSVTSLLEGDVYDAETRKTLLFTIKEGARRMNRFIANLLDMARLEGGILKLNKRWCDIQDMIGVVLREMQEILQDHPIRISLPPDIPLVEADFALLEQVVINLLENAAKYSPPAGEITISSRSDKGEVRMTVTDQGPAIPPGDRGVIFNKFYRLHSTRHVSGTGIGLSICKGIVEAHGGRIWVESTMGQGNAFSFTLPIGSQPAPGTEEADGRMGHVV